MKGHRQLPKRLKKIFAAAEAAGWTRDFDGKGHPRLHPPRGRIDREGKLVPPIGFALTPSDVRGDKNGIARLRRNGVEI